MYLLSKESFSVENICDTIKENRVRQKYMYVPNKNKTIELYYLIWIEISEKSTIFIWVIYETMARRDPIIN